MHNVSRAVIARLHAWIPRFLFVVIDGASAADRQPARAAMNLRALPQDFYNKVHSIT
jgi:hypothetical protein